ncbi:hypothetical protein [Pseudofrankia sp. BMG5.36]|uniref:hypothetical protein n=1 Tax=Pseudofrankia sp. BMG5.36 TaxID=1834512 RepID=UPI0008D92750|nr:hypothetical protein [Pseudofrankia sp. BMG5.36]OHV43538.1 hypothetical protein BCD48_27550 [Pseudofrankia sp. BMG5.36]
MTLDESTFQLPLNIEDIDAAWLTTALSKSFPGITVKDFEILTVRHGFTTVVRIRLDVDEAGRKAGVPETVILKGGFEAWSRDRARTYAMEALAYRDVWPVLPLNVPKSYFADIDAERKQAIIIMEDLVPRGVTFGNGLKPLRYDQVAQTLSALAKLHAATWNSPELEPGVRWDTSSQFEPDGRWVGVANNGAAMFRTYMYLVGYLHPDIFQRFVGMPRGAASSKEFHDLEWAKLALDYIAALGDVLPNCIVHGDMHLGNVFEEPDGTPGFFDAPPRKEPPYLELAYWITCSLDVADRRRWDRALVGHYLAELGRNGVEPPDLDETMHHFAAYLTYGYYVFLINEAHWQTESFNTVHAARFSAAMVDHGTKQLIIEAAKDPTIAKPMAKLPQHEVTPPSRSQSPSELGVAAPSEH